MAFFSAVPRAVVDISVRGSDGEPQPPPRPITTFQGTGQELAINSSLGSRAHETAGWFDGVDGHFI